ncbi:hypothetical protein D3C80_1517430 [compost metagenome]
MFECISYRIRQDGNLLQAFSDCADPADIQCKAVEHGFRRTGLTPALQIFGVGGDNGRGLLTQSISHDKQCFIFLAGG